MRNQLSFRDNKLSYAALQVLCNAKETEGEEKMPSFDIVSE
ncbi:YajQ family cyclic di-GMP-binding protein, partial [Acinetobacter baumannii]